MPDFKGFRKIARLNREIIVSEKIDGTNGLIHIGDDGVMSVGSRSRWITPEDDNHGFARWARAHEAELVTLGPGYHYGEWWGGSIQRGYEIKEKRFSLFNVTRWAEDMSRPPCCSVVPVLARSTDIHEATEKALDWLRTHGSVAAPGYMNPEGVVVFHTVSGTYFKVTLDNDGSPKGSK